MSEKEDLLNNLKIDDSQKSDSEPFPTKIVSIIVSGLAIIGLGLWFLLADEEIQEVTTFTVKSINASGSQASSILDASGYVVPRRRATVSSKITGKVLEVLVEEGMYVEKGQLLAQLDDSTYGAQLAAFLQMCFNSALDRISTVKQKTPIATAKEKQIYISTQNCMLATISISIS